MTADDDARSEAIELAHEEPPPLRGRGGKLPLPGNLRAVVKGIRETARDVLKAGREEAQRAHDEAWAHYDDLTKRRRER